MIGIHMDGYTQEIKYLVYPGGEVSINHYIPQLHEVVIKVFAWIECSEDFFALALLKDILDRQEGVEEITLNLAYVPYARQDRCMDTKIGNQALSIRVFANLLNSLGFDRVVITDPHSAVTPALINNCTVIDRSPYVRTIYENLNYSEKVVLVAPDNGAIKSVEAIAQDLDLDYVFALKKRNPENGHLEITSIPNVEKLQDCHMIVLDDICDGGKTFNLLSEFISKAGISPAKRTLYATHGIFSQGLTELLENYDTVITHNLFDKYKHLRENVIVDECARLTYFRKK